MAENAPQKMFAFRSRSRGFAAENVHALKGTSLSCPMLFDRSATDLDELIAAHDKYLATVLARRLNLRWNALRGQSDRGLPEQRVEP